MIRCYVRNDILVYLFLSINLNPDFQISFQITLTKAYTSKFCYTLLGNRKSSSKMHNKYNHLIIIRIIIKVKK